MPSGKRFFIYLYDKNKLSDAIRKNEDDQFIYWSEVIWTSPNMGSYVYKIYNYDFINLDKDNDLELIMFDKEEIKIFKLYNNKYKKIEKINTKYVLKKLSEYNIKPDTEKIRRRIDLSVLQKDLVNKVY